MKKEEVIDWLTIMKANLNSFPEVSNAKKIEALAEAIRLLIFEESEELSSSEIPNKSEKLTGSDDCISRKDVLSEIIRFSTEEGSSVECQQLYCDVNNIPSVTPQEPTARNDNQMLEDIKGEILEQYWGDSREEYFNGNDSKEYIDGAIEAADYIIKMIDKHKGENNIPPVTPIRPKGHWTEHPHEWGDDWQYSDYECSICHNWTHFEHDFCPNCGADMREVEE